MRGVTPGSGACSRTRRPSPMIPPDYGGAKKYRYICYGMFIPVKERLFMCFYLYLRRGLHI
jgi:hypothetical protein